MTNGGWVEDWSDSFSEFEPRFDLSAHRHAKQLAIALDPSWIRCVIGTRRSGKTEENCLEALEVADQFPGESVPYVMPTIGRHKDIVYQKMQELSDKFDLNLHINRSDFKIQTPHGGTVQIYGLSTVPDAEKGRGKRFPLCIFDECGAITNQDILKRAVTETFGPACADFRGLGGRGLLLTGTPGYEPNCYWEQMCGGNTHVSKFGASVHFMTIYDNPFFDGRQEMIIDAYLKENGLSRSDAGFRREWEGEFCTDTEGLCYQRWNKQLLPRHMIPRSGYTVMGLDLGHYPDPCAWVVIRFVITESVVGDVVRSIHHGHIIASYEQTNCRVDEMSHITRKLAQAYGVSHIAGDTGGLGATIVDDLATQYNLPIVPVKKTGVKVGKIWMADSMFGAGTLHVHEGCDSLSKQLSTVPWDSKRLHHNKKYPDHSCFIAGTMVQTASGERPIESIRIGDRVHTRQGLNPVAMTGVLSPEPVLEVSFSDGSSLVGTGNHPIWHSETGWKRLDALAYGDTVEAWQRAKQSCSTESPTDVTRRAGDLNFSGTTSPRVSADCTGTSGFITTDRSPKTTKYITETVTGSTTTSLIWSALPKTGTVSTTGTSQGLLDSESAGVSASDWHRSGTGLQKDWLCTAELGNNPGKPGSVSSDSAQCAARTLRVGSVDPGQSSDAQEHVTRKHCVTVVGVRTMSESQPVYNLSIENVHEYYANGILVSNCDAMLYALTLSRQHEIDTQLPPEPGTREWYELQERLDEQSVLEFARQRRLNAAA